MTMKILHQSSSRHLGREDGFSGRSSQCPKGADTLSYAAGFVEGRAARRRGIAGGIGLLNNGSVNVVEKGSPRQEPTIVEDEEDLSDLDEDIE
jgi:hypothetical protein